MKRLAAAIVLFAPYGVANAIEPTSKTTKGFFVGTVFPSRATAPKDRPQDRPRSYLCYREGKNIHRLFLVEVRAADSDGADMVFLNGKFFVVQIRTSTGSFMNYFYERTAEGAFVPLFKSQFNGKFSLAEAVIVHETLFATVSISPDETDHSAWRPYVIQLSKASAEVGTAPGPLPFLALKRAGKESLKIIGRGETFEAGVSINRVPLKLKDGNWVLEPWKQEVRR